MKTKSIFLLLAMFLALNACNRNSQCTKDQTLVDSLLNAVTLSWKSGDINKLVAEYANDAIVLSGTWKMGGTDSIKNGWKVILPYATNPNFYHGVSSVSRDMVFWEGLFTFDWHQGDYSALAKGVSIMVWKKQADGSWKITYDAENHGDLVKK